MKENDIYNNLKEIYNAYKKQEKMGGLCQDEENDLHLLKKSLKFYKKEV